MRIQWSDVGRQAVCRNGEIVMIRKLELTRKEYPVVIDDRWYSRCGKAFRFGRSVESESEPMDYDLVELVEK